MFWIRMPLAPRDLTRRLILEDSSLNMTVKCCGSMPCGMTVIGLEANVLSTAFCEHFVQWVRRSSQVCGSLLPGGRHHWDPGGLATQQWPGCALNIPEATAPASWHPRASFSRGTYSPHGSERLWPCWPWWPTLAWQVDNIPILTIFFHVPLLIVWKPVSTIPNTTTKTSCKLAPHSTSLVEASCYAIVMSSPKHTSMSSMV